MHTNCPVCFGECKLFFDLYDDRYGYLGIYPLLKCPSCGHKSLKGEFSEELLKKLYSEYYPRSVLKLESYKVPEEKSGFFAWLNGEKSSAFRWVPKNVRVLDIGCGFGESLGYYKSRGCDAYGVEADENIRRVAERFGYKVHIGLFNPDIYEPDFFDYVTMAQVIEHVTDPVETLKGVARVLKPGGNAILSTPNSNGWGARVFGRRWINWHVPYHLQHFSINSMKIAAEKAGMELKEYRTITSSEWLFYQWLHLITYPKMGEPSDFWSGRVHHSLKKRLLAKLAIGVHLCKINHLVTRIFDAFSMGDNFVFVLHKPITEGKDLK